ncbi:MAG TPA: hypothetical protein VGQ05_24800 [Streptosporangiaceae bacterium]|nr:hypothetical protein [Streptosporangiaceae bacterium]
MTDLEDRLRAELDAFAQRANPAVIRPLRPPPGRAPRQAFLRTPRRMRRWLAPVAAAAAVAVVIAGVTLAVPTAGHNPVTGPGPIAGVPPYYLTLDQPSKGLVATAVLRSSATGAVLSRARVSLMGSEQPSVTGSADGRTYVVVDNTFESAGHGYGVRFYRLQAGPQGRSLRVDRLPISTFPLAVDDVALSPDGRELAIAEQSCRRGGCQYNQIQARSLATGATRTWRTRHDGAPWNLSWAGGRQIGFLWEGNLKPHSPRLRSGYRLLDVTGPGGDLLAAGPVVQLRPNPGHDIPAAFATPDGRAFVTSSSRVVHGQDHRVTVTAKIIKVSARTGKVQRVLYTESASGVLRTYGRTGSLDEQRCMVLALDRTGEHPLIQCFVMGRFSFGTLLDGHLAPMAGLPNSYCVRECRGPMWGDATW